MFASNLKESQTDEIKIQHIQYGILKSLIDFCYTASIKVQSENALDLLSAADMLQFEGIKQCCCAFLQTKLDIQNCLSLATFADIHTCQTLKETAEEYSRKHFRAVMNNDEFQDISFEQLKQLLSNDSLAVVSEKDVFDAAVAWISYDEKERKKHFYDLLKEVRLGNLTPKLIGKICELEKVMLYHKIQAFRAHKCIFKVTNNKIKVFLRPCQRSMTDLFCENS